MLLDEQTFNAYYSFDCLLYQHSFDGFQVTAVLLGPRAQ